MEFNHKQVFMQWSFPLGTVENCDLHMYKYRLVQCMSDVKFAFLILEVSVGKKTTSESSGMKYLQTKTKCKFSLL